MSSQGPLSLSTPPLTHSTNTSPNWSRNFESVTIQPFTTQTGPTINVPEDPINIFNIDDLVQLMVLETNRYAKKVLGNKFDSWQQTTVSEIRAYLGFHILKAINILPSDDDYKIVASITILLPPRVSRDRFRELGHCHYLTGWMTCYSTCTSQKNL